MLGSLHDDSDVKETGKKAMGLDKQNNNSPRTSHFLCISLQPLNDYNVKLSNFTFCGGHEQRTMTFFFFL